MPEYQLEFEVSPAGVLIPHWYYENRLRLFLRARENVLAMQAVSVLSLISVFGVISMAYAFPPRVQITMILQILLIAGITSYSWSAEISKYLATIKQCRRRREAVWVPRAFCTADNSMQRYSEIARLQMMSVFLLTAGGALSDAFAFPSHTPAHALATGIGFINLIFMVISGKLPPHNVVGLITMIESLAPSRIKVIGTGSSTGRSEQSCDSEKE